MKDPSNTTILAAHLAARGLSAHLAATFAEQLGACARLAKKREIAGGAGIDALARRVAAQWEKWASREACAALNGLSITIGGDPRGHCLHVVGLPGNSLGGDESGFGL